MTNRDYQKFEDAVNEFSNGSAIANALQHPVHTPTALPLRKKYSLEEMIRRGIYADEAAFIVANPTPEAQRDEMKKYHEMRMNDGLQGAIETLAKDGKKTLSDDKGRYRSELVDIALEKEILEFIPGKIKAGGKEHETAKLFALYQQIQKVSQIKEKADKNSPLDEDEINLILSLATQGIAQKMYDDTIARGRSEDLAEKYAAAAAMSAKKKALNDKKFIAKTADDYINKTESQINTDYGMPYKDLVAQAVGEALQTMANKTDIRYGASAMGLAYGAISKKKVEKEIGEVA